MNVLICHQFAVEIELASSRLIEPQKRPANRRFAAAGLPDKAERLARLDLEGDTVHRLQRNRLEKSDLHREILL